MEVPLTLLLLNDPRLLQEVVVDVTTDRVAFEVEVDVHVLSKPRGVVIPIGLGVSECFQNVIGLKENILHSFYLILLGHVGYLGMVQFSVKLFVLNGGDLSSRQKVVVRPTLAMYLIITLLASVFPEPDSPGIISNINYRTGIRVETQT